MGLFDKIFGKKKKKDSSNTNKKQCPNCGHELNSMAINCRFCGYNFDIKKIPEKKEKKDSSNTNKKQCPNCGHELNSMAINCGFCGYNFDIKKIQKTANEKRLTNTKVESKAYEKKEDIKNINSESDLIRIAKNNPDYLVRWRAVEKINNEETLVYVAKNDDFRAVRKEAINKINSESALIDIFKDESTTNDIGNVILNRLRILNPDCDVCIEPESVLQINDQSKLVEIAKNAFDYESRSEAVKKITDEKVLSDIALNDSTWFIRRDAVRNKNLKDEMVLRKVADNDPYYHEDPVYESIDSYKVDKIIKRYRVRDAAKSRLKDLGYE